MGRILLGLGASATVCRTRQRRQAMRGAGSVAALVMYTVDPRGLKVAARRGPHGVDHAPHVLADLAVQRDAARRLELRAAHDGMVRRQLRRQVRRREPARGGLRLAPIERRAEKSTARAASDARVPHGAARLQRHVAIASAARSRAVRSGARSSSSCALPRGSLACAVGCGGR